MPHGRARPHGTSEPAAVTRGPGLFAEVRHFDSIDSTNRYLLDEARRGAPEGLVAVAGHQLAGRGRRDRSWVAPPGSSLLVSVLLRPDLPPRSLGVVGVAMALAAVEACESVAGFRPGLKWPNDLVSGERKLGGILSEAEVGGPAARAVVVGLGLNLRWPSGAPAGLGHLAVALEEAGDLPAEAGPGTVLAALLASLDARYRDLSRPGGSQAQMSQYRDACVTLGQDVIVETARGPLEGLARDIDDAGRLVIEASGTRRAIASGDVVHLRRRHW